MKYGNFIDIDTCTIEQTTKTGQTWLIQIQADLLGESFSDSQIAKYVLKRVSFGSKDCTKELKLECAYFLGQTS